MPSSTYFTFHTSTVFYLLRLALLPVVLCKSMSTMAAGCPAVDYTRYMYTNLCINLPTYWCAIYCHWEGRALFKLIHWKAITPASLCPAMFFADLGLVYLLLTKKLGANFSFSTQVKNQIPGGLFTKQSYWSWPHNVVLCKAGIRQLCHPKEHVIRMNAPKTLRTSSSSKTGLPCRYTLIWQYLAITPVEPRKINRWHSILLVV